MLAAASVIGTKAEPVVKAKTRAVGRSTGWVPQVRSRMLDPAPDFHAVRNGFVSVAVAVDLTRHRALEPLATWLELEE